MSPTAVLARRGTVTIRPARRLSADGVVVAVPGVVAFLASVALSWRPSYWLDETVTVSSTVEPLPELRGVLARTDAVHGLYYLLLHPWAQVSVAAWWLRLPSAFAVGATAALVAVLGRQLGGRRVGLYSGLVFALLPITSYYGMEARGYALSMMFAAGATVSLVRAVRGGGTRWWVAHGVLLVLAVSVFLFSALLVAGFAVWMMTGGPAGSVPSSREPTGPAAGPTRVRRPGARRAWALTTLVAGVITGPLVAVAAAQQGQVAWVARPSQKTTLDVWEGLWFSSATVLAVVMWTLVAIAAAAAGLPRWRRSDRDRDLLVLCLSCTAAPPVVLLAGSAVHPIFVPRYVLGCVVPLSVLGGYGLTRLPFRSAGAIGLVVVLLAGSGAQRAQRRVDGKGDVISSLAAVVQRERRPGDALVFVPEYWRSVAVAYPRAFVGLPDLALVSELDLSRRPDPAVVTQVEMVHRLAGTGRVWLVTERGATRSGPAGVVAARERAALRTAGFTVVRTYPGERTGLALVTRG